MELEHVFKDLKIKSYIDQENNPWFKGKDIATILGYKDTKQALKKHVDEEDKMNFEVFNSKWGVEKTPLTFNEKTAKYINESGLYSLVLKSKMKEAKVFKKWVTSEVLPSIRKRGEYNLKQELSIEFQQKLSIMDSRISDIQRQSELDKLNAEKEYTLRLAKEKELEDSRKQIQLLTNHLKTHTNIPKDELIYILTNNEDLKQNVFKVGKTTKKSLNPRLSTYNTGKSSESYYVYIKETVNAQYIEKILDFLLKDFKLGVAFEEKTKEEMYKIHFDDLVKVLNCLIKAPNKTAEFLNFNHEKIFKNSFSLESVVERVRDWKTNKDAHDEIKDVKISIIKTPIKIDNIETNVKRWFNENIMKSENIKDFIGMKDLVKRFRKDNPKNMNEKRISIENSIDNLFKNIGVVLKLQYNYYGEDNSRKLSRRVYIGYTLKNTNT